MTSTEFVMIFPGSPVLSLGVWFIGAIIMLYLARSPAHRAIRSLSRVLHAGLRVASRSVLLAERKLVDRNREVLLAAGRESVERIIEREFHRVGAVVKRDLSGYPALQLALDKQINLIDEDYRESTELPPPPPTWVHAVEVVANIPSTGDMTVANIMEEIHKTIVKQYKSAMDEYRSNMRTRHSLLKRMMPSWRKLAEILDQVGKTIAGLQERANVIDRKMAEYEEIRAQTDSALRTLTASSTTQFFVSGLALFIAFGGAVINFNLIALPMSEMVGGGGYIGQFRTSHVAALVIILLEMAMGIYLMESLRITKLFPVIGSMDDRMRTKMIWITFSILLVLASVESALAFMRDRIAEDMQALRQSLANAEVIEPVNGWIPTVGQMVMGFILPFALTFVAIPLESFVHSSRTVMGVLASVSFRGVAFFLRLLGNIANYLGELMVDLYDLLIFPPLWIERIVHERAQQARIKAQEEAS